MDEYASLGQGREARSSGPHRLKYDLLDAARVRAVNFDASYRHSMRRRLPLRGREIRSNRERPVRRR